MAVKLPFFDSGRSFPVNAFVTVLGKNEIAACFGENAEDTHCELISTKLEIITFVIHEISMKKVSKALLSETADVIFQLNPKDYAGNLAILKGNSIGKHVRHILDLFECVILASENGKLNYDERGRNRETETDKAFAYQKIQAIIKDLQELSLEKKIMLKQKLGDAVCEMDSTLERELLYNIEHCIHHLAIIRIGIENNFEYVRLPENFGIAHSTISHREQTAD